MAVKSREIAGYRILAHIGTGAASVLYAVQDPATKQVWALKHVSKAQDTDHRFIEQIEREYEIGSQLKHPAIRGVERLIRHRKLFRVTSVSLVMELVDGTPMDQKLPRDQHEAVREFAEVARGLAHMHSRGYVHADMKPSNILITDSGHVKIIDLGQACAINTVKKRIQGTPGYMAPEQAHRQAITPQTDIYNFGATMYWVLVREVIPTALPPKDESGSLYTGALEADMVKPAVPPHEKRPDIHPLLSKQIMDCVQIRPDDRPASMDIVANRLELIADLLKNNGESGSGNASQRTGAGKATRVLDDDTDIDDLE